MVKYFGIDVGAYSIKVCQVNRSRQGYRVAAIGSILNPIGQIPGDDPNQIRQVSEAIKSLVRESGVRQRLVNVALSESQVYTRLIELPPLSDSELSSAMSWEAEQYIPIPVEEVNLDYQVISRPEADETEEKMKILLIAAPKRVVARIAEVVAQAGLEPMGIETELIGVMRVFFKPTRTDQPTALICHFGSATTDLAVMRQGAVATTYSIATGGLALTRSIANNLSMDILQAEEYKRTYGLEEKQLEGKVRGAMIPVVDIIVSEIKKGLQFYATKIEGDPVKLVILSGGTAHLPNIVATLAKALGLEVVVGNPFANMAAEKGITLPGDYASYVAVVGLAIRGE